MANILGRLKTWMNPQTLRNAIFVNQNLKQIVFKNTFWLFIAECFNKGASFLLIIFTARYLGASAFGKFNYALSFTGLFAIFADLGLSTLLIRDIARDHEKATRYFNSIAWLKIFLGLGTLSVIGFFAFFLESDATARMLLLLLGIFIIINSFNDFIRGYFRAFSRMEYEAYSKVLQGIILAACTVFVIVFQKSVEWLAVSYVVAAFCTFVANVYFLSRKFVSVAFCVNVRGILELLKMSLPFAISSFFVLIYMKLDVIMISKMNGDFAAGIYSALYNFLYAVLFLPGVVIGAVYPILSGLYAKGEIVQFKRVYMKLLKTFAALGFLIVLFFVPFSSLIIKHTFGEEYLSGASSLSLLSVAVLFSFVSHANLVAMNSINFEKKYLYSTMMAAVLNVGLNLFLIPRYSILGASAATVVAEIAGWSYCFFVLRTKMNYEQSKGLNSRS